MDYLSGFSKKKPMDIFRFAGRHQEMGNGRRNIHQNFHDSQLCSIKGHAAWVQGGNFFFFHFAFVVFNSDFFEKEVTPMGSLCFQEVTFQKFCFLWRKTTSQATKMSNVYFKKLETKERVPYWINRFSLLVLYLSGPNVRWRTQSVRRCQVTYAKDYIFLLSA